MGCIVCSNGKESQQLVTKRQALEIGEGLVDLLITDTEWLAIKEQIHSSPLLDKSTQLEEAVNSLQGKVDEILRLVRTIIDQERKKRDEGEDWKFGEGN